MKPSIVEEQSFPPMPASSSKAFGSFSYLRTSPHVM
jgi:hypothetical protein